MNLLKNFREKRKIKSEYAMGQLLDKRNHTQIEQFESASVPSMTALRLYANALDLTDKEIADIVLGRIK